MTNRSKNKWIIRFVAVTCFTFSSVAAIATEHDQNQIAENCKPYLTQEVIPSNLSSQANAALEACYQNNSCQTEALSDVSGCTRKLLSWESSYDLPAKNISSTETSAKTVTPAHPADTQYTAPAAPPVEKEQVAPVDLSGSNSNTETQTPKKKTGKPAINWF